MIIPHANCLDDMPISVALNRQKEGGITEFLNASSFLLHDPDLICKVFVREARLFTEEPHPYMHGRAFLTEEGQIALNLCRPDTVATTFDKAASYAKAAVCREAHKLRQQAQEKGGIVDLLPWLSKITFRIATQSLFGVELEDCEDEFIEAAELHEECLATQRRVELNESESQRLRQKGQEIWARLRVVANRIIVYRQQIASVGPMTYSGAPPAMIVIRTLLNAYAGSAVTLAWAALLLARHSDVQMKLRNDQDGNDALLEAVLLETLRLYPTAWMMTRQASEDREVGNRVVPRGSRVHVCLFSLHRDPRYWSDADSFRFDRFLADKHGGAPPFAFLPFGIGPHRCAAAGFAIQTMKATLKGILAQFIFEAHQEPLIRAVPLVALRPLPGALVRLSE